MAQGPLVSADWLIEHARSDKVRVVDCRFSLSDPEAGRRAYRAGHIPGALYLDLEQALSAPKRPDGAGGRHPLPDPEALAVCLGQAGIGGEHLVVAYDEPPGGGMYAARLWWLLRWMGHDAVAVLDGGLSAWIEAGGGLDVSVVRHPPASFTPRVRPELVTDASGVMTRAENVTLIDSRAAARYAGETEPLDKKAGHIPGAVNIDWSASLDEHGYFRTPQEQRARFGPLLEQQAIVYCGSGVSATVNLLALELAGKPPGTHTRLYAGSWSDWVSDDARPIATGHR
ncbi:sulfurtransferase [Deinococcus peraridilitoris]|uniref:Rhodanese-related sulfurtransferase n=1 Tax=Deinococcus peraridilitoris (strain DSM 19664 / LMG 22246 / CIP 109416 / KR-200) TaxID=937777 RepID=L0A4C9_DEIPD|nr:sulfurtransferase [Deinococcus peraridilitoris]AFZ67885.1 rhodanese-related sulfurtransferase [Deinococcus peraridilitoris DSM 19664]